MISDLKIKLDNTRKFVNDGMQFSQYQSNPNPNRMGN
jgi:hypothetical protein